MIFVPPRFAADSILEAAAAGVDARRRDHRGHPRARRAARLQHAQARLPGHAPGRPELPGHPVARQGERRDHPGVVLQGGQRRRRLALGHADLPDRQRDRPARLRQLARSSASAATRSRARSFVDIIELFQADDQTELIVLSGEIGGSAEEEAADYIAAHVTKPVIGYIAGLHGAPGKQMGHAGAIVSGSAGTAAAKAEALEERACASAARRPRSPRSPSRSSAPPRRPSTRSEPGDVAAPALAPWKVRYPGDGRGGCKDTRRARAEDRRARANPQCYRRRPGSAARSTPPARSRAAPRARSGARHGQQDRRRGHRERRAAGTRTRMGNPRPTRSRCPTLVPAHAERRVRPGPRRAPVVPRADRADGARSGPRLRRAARTPKLRHCEQLAGTHHLVRQGSTLTGHRRRRRAQRSRDPRVRERPRRNHRLWHRRRVPASAQLDRGPPRRRGGARPGHQRVDAGRRVPVRASRARGRPRDRRAALV